MSFYSLPVDLSRGQCDIPNMLDHLMPLSLKQLRRLEKGKIEEFNTLRDAPWYPGTKQEPYHVRKRKLLALNRELKTIKQRIRCLEEEE